MPDHLALVAGPTKAVAAAAAHWPGHGAPALNKGLHIFWSLHLLNRRFNFLQQGFELLAVLFETRQAGAAGFHVSRNLRQRLPALLPGALKRDPAVFEVLAAGGQPFARGQHLQYHVGEGVQGCAEFIYTCLAGAEQVAVIGGNAG